MAKSIRLHADIRVAPLTARTLRLASAEYASSEQQSSVSKEADCSSIDSGRLVSSPPAWERQQSPSVDIEQWLSAAPSNGASKQPARQFKPPHQSTTAMAARRQTNLPAGSKLKPMAKNSIRLATRKSRAGLPQTATAPEASLDPLSAA